MKYMEKKNMVLLTVIAVATLLVAVVGATFAYFTATSTTTGNKTSVDATTAQVSALSWTSTEEAESPAVYPGYMGIRTYTLSATGEGSAKYTLTLDANVAEGFEDGDLTYSIYRSTSPIATSLLKAGDINVDTTTQPGETRYSITGVSFDSSSLTEVVSNQNLTDGTAQAITGASDLTVSANQTIYYVLVVNFPNENTEQDLQGLDFSAGLRLTAVA